MGRSSVEAYAGIGIGILLAVLPMTWWLKALSVLVLAGIVTDLSFRSPWTSNFGKSRIVLCVVAIAVISWN